MKNSSNNQYNHENKKKLNIKKYLIAGVIVWLPILATIWVITYIIKSSDALFNLLPRDYHPENILGFHIPGLGLIVALLVLLITGIFAANVIGKKIINIWDGFFGHIPIIKSIYKSVKKVSESVLSDTRESFKKPVLVQFPSKGIWTIGFISGSIPKSIKKQINTNDYEFIPVYIPTTPNPTSGYYVFVNKSETKELNLTIDEALKYIISLGIVIDESSDNKIN